MASSRMLGALFATLLVAVLLTACSTSKQDPSLLVGSTWVVTKYLDANKNMVRPTGAVSDSATLTLRFLDSSKLAGTGGVNSFGADYRASKDGTMRIGAITSTEIGADPALMGQESNYFERLGRAAAYEVTSDSLILFDSDGEQLVRFRPQEPVSLEKTQWTCTGFNSGGEAFVELAPGTRITLELEDGVAAGSAGVNAYSGSYVLDGKAIQFSSAAAVSEKAGTADALDQESAYLAMLPTVARWEISGETLTLFGSGDLRLASYKAQ